MYGSFIGKNRPAFVSKQRPIAPIVHQLAIVSHISYLLTTLAPPVSAYCRTNPLNYQFTLKIQRLMSLAGGKGNLLRRTNLSGERSNNSTGNRHLLSQNFHITFSFLVQFLCPCQDEKTWVESLSSYQAVSGPVEKAKPKKTRFSSYIRSSNCHAATYGFSLGSKPSTTRRFHPRKRRLDRLLQSGDGATLESLAATFRDNVEPGWITTPPPPPPLPQGRAVTCVVDGDAHRECDKPNKPMYAVETRESKSAIWETFPVKVPVNALLLMFEEVFICV